MDIYPMKDCWETEDGNYVIISDQFDDDSELYQLIEDNEIKTPQELVDCCEVLGIDIYVAKVDYTKLLPTTSEEKGNNNEQRTPQAISKS